MDRTESLTMSYKDQSGLMPFIGKGDKSPESETNPRGSKINILGELLGQATFVATDALWSREQEEDESETFDRFLNPNSPQSSCPSRSPSPCSLSGESDVDRLILELKEQNDNLRSELDVVQQREVDLGHKLEQAEDRLHKEIIMFESGSLDREEDARDDISQESKRGASVSETRELAHTNFDLQYSFTQNDELQFTKEKVAELEEKLRLCEKSTQPLKSKLEEATARAVEAEEKLAEREEDLVHLFRFTEDLEQKYEELQHTVVIHKEEADELRRQLAEGKQQEREGKEGSFHSSR